MIGQRSGGSENIRFPVPTTALCLRLVLLKRWTTPREWRDRARVFLFLRFLRRHFSPPIRAFGSQRRLNKPHLPPRRKGNPLFVQVLLDQLRMSTVL